MNGSGLRQLAISAFVVGNVPLTDVISRLAAVEESGDGEVVWSVESGS